MRRLLGAALVAVGLAAAVPAVAERLGPVIASYGNWDIRRSAELMSDRTKCTATYRSDSGVQLTRTALYLRVARNPSGYEFRIDDEPTLYRLGIPTHHLFWLMRAIAIGGPEFQRIVRARRLRVAVTSLHQLFEFDLDLDGISNAYSAVYYCR